MSGALPTQISSLILPPVLEYVDVAAHHILAALEVPVQYAAAHGLHPSAVYYSTLLGLPLLLLITFFTMSSRYGWSRQESYQPHPPGTVPHVMDSDYAYITSEDIDRPPYPNYPPTDPHHSNPSIRTPDVEEDDVLHVVFPRGREYQLQFPAYSIGDGQLFVGDVQDRIAFLLQIAPHLVPDIGLKYKGTRLANPQERVRSYGVKNHSELLALLPERNPASTSPASASRSAFDRPNYPNHSGSESETVVITDDRGRVVRRASRGRRQSSVKHASTTSPRTSGTNLQVPSPDGFGPPGVNMGSATSKRAPSHQRAKPQSLSPAMQTLEDIAHDFETTLLPLCEEFARAPPSDKQKREDEHKKLEEMAMQKVLLKLDAVETDGDNEVRMRRKELVRHVQSVLNGIDQHKA